MQLTGKTALVTGGGTGIGLGIALGLAEQGCRVAIAGRRADKLKAAVESYSGEPGLLSCVVDVGNPQSVEELFRWASSALGSIDILVNSAGVNVARRTMAELSPEDWESMLRVNVSGAYYCLRAVLPQMRARKDGLIVNISSTSGKRASMLGGVGYCASKFAMTALGHTVALEDGRHGIRVSNVYPGEVDTPILEHRPTPVSAERRALMLKPQDVAAAVVMIACLPPRAHVAELIIKPTVQDYA